MYSVHKVRAILHFRNKTFLRHGLYYLWCAAMWNSEQ